MDISLCINSKSNEKVKFIKSLNDKKFRIINNAFYLEGIKVVNEILDSKKAIDILFIAYSDEILKSTKQGNNILEKINSKDYTNISRYNFSKNIFNYMCDTVTPQGILVVLNIENKNIDYLINDANNNNENILIIDKVQDAGNLGTIIRSANAFKIKNIICISGTVDAYSQKVIRSTMGTMLNTNMIYVTYDQMKAIKQKLNENNFLIASSMLNAKSYIQDLDFSKKYAFVLGNEANGISKEMLSLSDNTFKIDIKSNVESLNVAVACGIILFNQYKK